MSEESGTSIKSILIGLVSTITIAVGGFITNKLTGGEEEEAKQEVAAPAPVINITNSNQQQQAADRTIVINRSAPANAAPATKSAPAAKPVKTDTEKRKEEGLEW
jgi:hypothetical protein